MKKYLIIGIIIGIIVFGFIIPPPDGLFRMSGDIASTSTPDDPPSIINTEPQYSDLLTTQIEDDYFEIDSYKNFNKQNYSQILYPSGDKTTLTTANAYKLIAKSKTNGYISDTGKNITYKSEITDTNLDEVNILTLYARVKKDGIGGKDRKFTAKLMVSEKPVISIYWDNTYLEKGWTTKWLSVSGTFTKEEINNAYIEVFTESSGTGTMYPILLSSMRIYAEDQHSLTDNLDLYSTGDINGQDSWVGPTDWHVVTDYAQSGANSVNRAEDIEGAVDLYKIFTEETDGKQVYYWYSTTTTDYLTVFMCDGPDIAVIATTLRTLDGSFQYYIPGQYVVLYEYAQDTWYKIEIQWRSSDRKVRYIINDTLADSGWVAPRQNTWVAIDRINLETNSGGGMATYVDSFSDPNAAPPTVPSEEDFPQIDIID